MSIVYLLMGSVFVIGTVVGSFLNVCICRLPEGRSVVHPRSSCPSCGNMIRWYQNIPILSFLCLRGRCGFCGQPIGWRYPAIEALTGVLYCFVVWCLGLGPWTVVYLLFVSSLVVITFIDLDHQIIPDVISLPGILVGFIGSFFVPWLGWLDSIFGVLLGGGLLYAVALAYEWFKKNEGMGGGDIKLLAMIGAFMGWQAILPVLFLSSIFGVLLGVPFQVIQKDSGKMAIPFGPFLSLGAVVWLLGGSEIWRWYVSVSFYQ